MKQVRVLLTICIMLLSTPSVSASEEMWWEASIGYGGAVINRGTDVRSIPMYARIRDLTFSVPKSNPDALIVGIRFDQKFDEEPLASDKFLKAGIRLGNGITPNCIYDNTCEQVLYFTAPSSWQTKYPTYPESNTVTVYKIPQNQADGNDNIQSTNCPALWWIDRSPNSYDAFKFQLSITCLGIGKVMTAYGFSGADIGITPTPYNFTNVASADNPYWELAKSSYEKNGGAAGVTKPYNSKGQTSTKYVICKKGNKSKLIKASAKCPKGYKKEGTSLSAEGLQ